MMTDEEQELISKMFDRIDDLQQAIKACVLSFECISWGWDGDCGAERIIAKLEEVLGE